MKSELSALELHYLIKEFQVLVSAKVEQIYQLGREEFVFQLHLPGEGKRFLRIMMGKLLYLASSKPGVPEKPPNFCLFLRRKLKNSRIRIISQKNFERVIDILFETKDKKFNMHIELFSTGNLILADESDSVISALEYQEWKDRSIKPKKPYVPPTGETDLLTISKEDFKQVLLSSDKESLVKTLAIDFSLGGLFSEELCLASKIDKSVKASSLTDQEIDNLFQAVDDLRSRDLSPLIVYKDEKPFQILPFPLLTCEGSETKSFDSFNQAIDSVFTKHVGKRQIESVKKESKTNIDKIDEIIQQQKLRIKGLEVSEKENQRKGEMIYEHYVEVDDLLKKVRELRETGGWKEVKDILKSNPVVRSVNEKTGEITLEF